VNEKLNEWNEALCKNLYSQSQVKFNRDKSKLEKRVSPELKWNDSGGVFEVLAATSLAMLGILNRPHSSIDWKNESMQKSAWAGKRGASEAYCTGKHLIPEELGRKDGATLTEMDWAIFLTGQLVGLQVPQQYGEQSWM
jgi:hypothetical protein